MDDASIEQALATSVKNKDTVMENALKSWDSIKDDLGAFVSSETAVVTKGDDGYIARMNTVYEKRAMEFTLIADEDLSKVETISFSPVYTTGEKDVYKRQPEYAEIFCEKGRSAVLSAFFRFVLRIRKGKEMDSFECMR